MRLIDADSLIALVTDSTILGDGFKTAFCALVNGEPTVKVQKTGKWMHISKWKNEFDAVCSECGQRGKTWMNFCPNCGSRMEYEKE